MVLVSNDSTVLEAKQAATLAVGLSVDGFQLYRPGRHWKRLPSSRSLYDLGLNPSTLVQLGQRPQPHSRSAIPITTPSISILQSSFVIKPVKEIDVEIPVGVGVGGGVGVQMEEGVDEEDEAPEDNSQLTLAQLRTSFKTSILQYIQPVQWGLCLETGTRLVSSTAYVNITHLCRDDLVNLFTDIFKLSKSKYLLFGNEGFLENKVGEQLNNTGVVQAAFKGAIARYKTWTTTGLKF
ncbi:hypothetical protein HDU99_006126, partial [Rhizoclosmatium hyalinum]